MSTTTNTRTEAAPYGWYPDPAGSHKLRLWNGAEWTNELERKGSGVQPVFGYSADGRITRQFDY
jgi:hypothetical protein